MIQQTYAHTTNSDGEGNHGLRNQVTQGPFPTSTESGYAILYVDQGGHRKLLYAPGFSDVSSGHTSGYFEPYCPGTTKSMLRSNITKDHDLFERSSNNFFDILLRDLESDAATAICNPLVRKKRPDEFLPFREYGTFEVREAEVQKLELHLDLDT
jgi:hypothetical protein